MAVLGPSTTALPTAPAATRSRMVISPTSVLPAPGGSATQARVLPPAQAWDSAASASTWWTRRVTPVGVAGPDVAGPDVAGPAGVVASAVIPRTPGRPRRARPAWSAG